MRFDPWVGKIPWRRAWQPTPVFLAGESHGQRSPPGSFVHGVTKHQTQLSDQTQHRTVRSTETESRVVEARARGRGSSGGVRWEQSFSFTTWKELGDWLHNTVNIPSAAEFKSGLDGTFYAIYIFSTIFQNSPF